jgi:hypothetical protein
MRVLRKWNRLVLACLLILIPVRGIPLDVNPRAPEVATHIDSAGAESSMPIAVSKGSKEIKAVMLIFGNLENRRLNPDAAQLTDRIANVIAGICTSTTFPKTPIGRYCVPDMGISLRRLTGPDDEGPSLSAIEIAAKHLAGQTVLFRNEVDETVLQDLASTYRDYVKYLLYFDAAAVHKKLYTDFQFTPQLRSPLSQKQPHSISLPPIKPFDLEEDIREIDVLRILFEIFPESNWPTVLSVLPDSNTSIDCQGNIVCMPGDSIRFQVTCYDPNYRQCDLTDPKKNDIDVLWSQIEPIQVRLEGLPRHTKTIEQTQTIRFCSPGSYKIAVRATDKTDPPTQIIIRVRVLDIPKLVVEPRTIHLQRQRTMLEPTTRTAALCDSIYVNVISFDSSMDSPYRPLIARSDLFTISDTTGILNCLSSAKQRFSMHAECQEGFSKMVLSANDLADSSSQSLLCTIYSPYSFLAYREVLGASSDAFALGFRIVLTESYRAEALLILFENTEKGRFGFEGRMTKQLASLVGINCDFSASLKTNPWWGQSLSVAPGLMISTRVGTARVSVGLELFSTPSLETFEPSLKLGISYDLGS